MSIEYINEGYDPEDYCEKCGSSVFWEDCWQCGGSGGRDGEELMEEDPLWYTPDDFETCDICEGRGGWNICMNSDCTEKEDVDENV